MMTCFGTFNAEVQQFSETQSEASYFCVSPSIVGCIYLIIYVDDIVLTVSGEHGN